MVSKFNELVKSSAMVCGSFSSTFDLECLYTYLEITEDIVHITFDKKKKSKSPYLVDILSDAEGEGCAACFI